MARDDFFEINNGDGVAGLVRTLDTGTHTTHRQIVFSLFSACTHFRQCRSNSFALSQHLKMH